MNISVLIKNLLMNFLNLDLGLSCLIMVIFIFLVMFHEVLKHYRGVHQVGFMGKESREMRIGCLAFFQFLLIGVVKVSFNCLNNP